MVRVEQPLRSSVSNVVGECECAGWSLLNFYCLVESHVIAEKVLVFQSLPVELWQLFPIDDLDAARKLSL